VTFYKFEDYYADYELPSKARDFRMLTLGYTVKPRSTNILTKD